MELLFRLTDTFPMCYAYHSGKPLLLNKFWKNNKFSMKRL